MESRKGAEDLLQRIKDVHEKAEALQLVQKELRRLKASGEISDREIAEIYRALASTDRRFRRAVVDKSMLDRETIESLTAECAICSGTTDLDTAIKGGRWTFNEPQESLKIVVDEGTFKVFGACNNC